nr:DNA starvation/stationary phase protection protein [Bradyrhizobium yuanmingense]
MRGVVIIDPIVHWYPAQGFLSRNRAAHLALGVRRRAVNVRVLTGRSPVSKTNNKVSAELDTPTDLSPDGVKKVSEALNVLLADAFALYLKTKNFHWHISGRHFRDYHLLLDEQSDQIFSTTDQLAERVRKIGGTTLRSIGQVAKLQTIKDNNEDYVPPREMLRELMQDNKHVAAAMRKAHDVCDEAGDVASASILENFIDETERRTWFLFEATRQEGANEA